jgi:hypothetical protein
LLKRARDDATFLPQLIGQIQRLSPRYSPRREKATLLAIVAEALDTPSSGATATP